MNIFFTNILIKTFNFLVITLFCFFFVRCGSLEEKKRPKEIDLDSSVLHIEIFKGDSIIAIEWEIPDFAPGYQRFELLYRTQKETTWIPIDTSILPSDSIFVVLNRKSIKSDDSIFCLGIRSVSTIGSKSDIHESSDSSATPGGGWILFWPK